MTKEIKDKGITIRVPASILTLLKAEASANTRTMAAQVLHILKNNLGK
jgi:hypothetical protein